MSKATIDWAKFAGQPYRPPNGTEGALFEERFCLRCKHDQDWQQSEENPCKILSLAMAYYETDPEFPKEWVYDKDGMPCCTAFEQIPEVER